MFYPIGWHKVLHLESNPTSKIVKIINNSERELCLILTTTSIHLWNTRPPVEIASHERSEESLHQIGLNNCIAWKIDSSVIVVGTQRDQLIFYNLLPRAANSNWSSYILPNYPETNGIYRLKCDLKNIKNILSDDIQKEILRAKSADSKSQPIPAISLQPTGKLDLCSIGVSCLTAAEEELLVGARDGDFYGIHWNGNVDHKFPWSIKRSLNLIDNDDKNIFVQDLKFSSVLCGFAFVFNTGNVCFLPLDNYSNNDHNYDDVRHDASLGNESQAQSSPKTRVNKISFSQDINGAICVEINHKHKLIAVGLNDSRVLVCNVTEPNQELSINHILEFQKDKFPNTSAKLGSITSMRFSPDSFALATTWKSGHFAIWSLFGSLLFCSQQWQSDSVSKLTPFRINNLCWGREGHSIWMTSKSGENNDRNLDEDDPQRRPSLKSSIVSSHGDHNEKEEEEEIIILPIAHSSLCSSPHLTCTSDSILLMSEDRVYVGPSVPHKAEFDHWFIIDIPQDYLAKIYPLRYATVDRNCQHLAIAGKHGFALYTISSGKWIYSGKKSQEKDDFTVCGGMIWWNNHLVTSCYNLSSDAFEIRAYDTTSNLTTCVIHEITMEIIRMSLFENRLLVLYSDGSLAMFMMNLRKKHSLKQQPIDQRTSRAPSSLSLHISRIENLVISNLQANPYCISAIALTRLHFKNDRLDDSILLNAYGKLFLLERELPVASKASRSSPSSNSSSLNYNVNNNNMNTNMNKKVAFKAVSVIATNVEQFWISPEIGSSPETLSYFRRSLWLLCGGAGEPQLQVWLPLLNDKSDAPSDLYVPDRIMLPMKCDIYPLAIRSSTPDELTGPDDAIVMGAESDILYKDNVTFSIFPFNTVKRQCRVYLHKILRELLLKQHLGYYARKIAESCQTLPYFAHCFELLLHEVLEEESTSPKPLPDPMLPQVVEFIKKFPQIYLETVVHCARKSELSMWSHLFHERAVGSPERLFRECLERGKLDTAASCLLILQSLDKSIVSHSMLKDLTQAAKLEPKFEHLVGDLENFSIRAELENSTRSGSCSESSSPVANASPVNQSPV